MLVLGIESSCDECSAAIVADGKSVLSNITASQIEEHAPYDGVVPELASRLHTELIAPTVRKALEVSGLKAAELDGIAVTNQPGLSGSLLVGVSFAKGLSAVLGIPFVGVDHIRAHLYAPHLEASVAYPYLGLLVSGGHTVICIVHDYFEIEVLGTTIDDAAGEAYDKIAKHYDLGYPGGAVIDKLAAAGNPYAFDFPKPRLNNRCRACDVSYSGLKTAVINQLDRFWNGKDERSIENIAASFQRRAIAILIDSVEKALEAKGLERIAVGGGVAANSGLRLELGRLGKERGCEVVFPALELCTDNGAMIAGAGYQQLLLGEPADYALDVSARVSAFKSPLWKRR